jgi:hypothetical protein
LHHIERNGGPGGELGSHRGLCTRAPPEGGHGDNLDTQ